MSRASARHDPAGDLDHDWAHRDDRGHLGAASPSTRARRARASSAASTAPAGRACASPRATAAFRSAIASFSVRATDAAGNTDPTPAEADWTVTEPPPDTTPPETSISGGPDATHRGHLGQLRLRLQRGRLELRVQPRRRPPGPPATRRRPTAASRSARTVLGPRHRRGRQHGPIACDSVAGRSLRPPTPPRLTRRSAAGRQARPASTSASFSFNATEAGSSFECKLDTGAWASCASPKGYSGLAVGSHSSRSAPPTRPATRTNPGDSELDDHAAPPSGCDTIVASVSAAQTPSPPRRRASVVCLADGSYGKLTLNATKATPGVEMRSEHPGGATVAGASLNGSRLTLSRFRVIGDEVTVQPGSTGMVVDHNLISGGYFGVDRGPHLEHHVNDVSVIGNKFQGPFGEDAIRANRYHDTAATPTPTASSSRATRSPTSARTATTPTACSRSGAATAWSSTATTCTTTAARASSSRTSRPP